MSSLLCCGSFKKKKKEKDDSEKESIKEKKKEKKSNRKKDSKKDNEDLVRNHKKVSVVCEEPVTIAAVSNTYSAPTHVEKDDKEPEIIDEEVTAGDKLESKGDILLRKDITNDSDIKNENDTERLSIIRDSSKVKDSIRKSRAEFFGMSQLSIDEIKEEVTLLHSKDKEEHNIASGLGIEKYECRHEVLTNEESIVGIIGDLPTVESEKDVECNDTRPINEVDQVKEQLNEGKEVELNTTSFVSDEFGLFKLSDDTESTSKKGYDGDSPELDAATGSIPIDSQGCVSINPVPECVPELIVNQEMPITLAPKKKKEKNKTTPNTDMKYSEGGYFVNDREVRPPSLTNIGATCYLNSAFQGISACDTFVKDVNELCKRYSGPGVEQLHVFKELIDILNGCSAYKMEISRNQIFRNWNKPGQQDSYELLAYAMNQVYNQLRKHKEDIKDIPKRDLKRWLTEKLPMRFIMQYKIRCGCGLTTYSPLQSDLALHVTIPSGQASCVLDNLVDLYFGSDPIEDYECDKKDCNGLNTHRIARLAKPLPHTICIHLQRTFWNGYTMKKINKDIKFGTKLTLKSEYWYDEDNDGSVEEDDNHFLPGLNGGVQSTTEDIDVLTKLNDAPLVMDHVTNQDRDSDVIQAPSYRPEEKMEHTEEPGEKVKKSLEQSEITSDITDNVLGGNDCVDGIIGSKLSSIIGDFVEDLQYRTKDESLDVCNSRDIHIDNDPPEMEHIELNKEHNGDIKESLEKLTTNSSEIAVNVEELERYIDGIIEEIISSIIIESQNVGNNESSEVEEIEVQSGATVKRDLEGVNNSEDISRGRDMNMTEPLGVVAPLCNGVTSIIDKESSLEMKELDETIIPTFSRDPEMESEYTPICGEPNNETSIIPTDSNVPDIVSSNIVPTVTTTQQTESSNLDQHVLDSNSTKVQFPRKNEPLKQIKKKLTEKDETYELASVIVHWGDVYGGHYTCYKRVGCHWFLTNDSAVYRVDESEVLRCQAYILFYEQPHDDIHSVE